MKENFKDLTILEQSELEKINGGAGFYNPSTSLPTGTSKPNKDIGKHY